jgi:hypothetical protein
MVNGRVPDGTQFRWIKTHVRPSCRFVEKIMRAISMRFPSLLLSAALFLIFAAPAVGATNPVPFVNQPLAPAAAVPGGPAFTLTVNGTDFVSGTVVNWNGSARVTTFVSSSQLTASILASDIASTGTATVTVTNPGGAISLPVFFAISSSYPAVGFARTDAVILAPTGSATGDFNGDGIMDVAVYALGQIAILLGNGDGTFNQLSPISFGLGVPPLVAADVNNDGKMDLIGLGVVMLGNGDGTFQPPMSFIPGFQPQWIAVGDFNNDGKLDLAVANSCNINVTGCVGGTGSISVLLGNGDGTFQPQVQHSTGLFANTVAVGDFNRDGNLDLVVSDESGTEILLGNGDGSFQAPYTVGSASSGFSGLGLATADMNGDGILDLVTTGVTQRGTGAGAVYLGNGDGTFGAPISFSNINVITELLLGDFNGDGKLDVVLAFDDAGASSSVYLLLGNGDGTVQAASQFSVDLGAFNLSAGDFDRNGTLDLVVPGSVSDSEDLTLPILLTTTVVLPTDGPIFFGTENVGVTSPPTNVTLTNVNSVSLTISSIAIAGLDPADFAIQSNPCGTSLAPGASCTVAVTFTPTAGDTRNALLAFTDSAPASPQTVALSGIGNVVTAPIVTLSPTSLIFPAQLISTMSAAQPITLTNSGNGELEITRFEFTGDSSDFAETNTCGSSVNAGASCTISVTFSPTTTGSRTATLNIFDNAAGSPQTVAVSGTGTNTGISAPVFSPTSLTLTAGQSGSFTATVTPATGVGAVTFTCTGAPTAAACTPGTPVVNANGTVTSTITVTTTARSMVPSGPAVPPSGSAPLLMLFCGFACGLGAFLLSARLRPSWKVSQRAACATIVLLVMSFGMLAACGGGGSGGGGQTGTPAGTYMLNITASASGQMASSTFTLTVN